MISSCELKTRVSKKGSEYYTLDIVFKNGYKKVIFLDNAEQFMFKAFVDKSLERR